MKLDIPASLPWYMYLISMVLLFCAVFLKGFQHQNVIHRKMKAIFFTSVLMQIFDYAFLSFAVAAVLTRSWMFALTSGIAAGIAMVTSIWFFDFIYSWMDRQMESFITWWENMKRKIRR